MPIVLVIFGSVGMERSTESGWKNYLLGESDAGFDRAEYSPRLSHWRISPSEARYPCSLRSYHSHFTKYKISSEHPLKL